MSHWNFRLCKENISGYICYSIHEVHYNDDGAIYAYVEEPASIHGFEDISELRKELEYIGAALDKPVLELPLKELALTPWQEPSDEGAVNDLPLDELKLELQSFGDD